MQIFLFQNKDSVFKGIKLNERINFFSNDSGPHSFSDINKCGKEPSEYIFHIVPYLFRVNLSIHRFRYINKNEIKVFSEYYKAEPIEYPNSFNDITFYEENLVIIYHYGVYEPLVENAENMTLLNGMTTKIESYLEDINPLDFRAKKLKNYFKNFDSHLKFVYDPKKDFIEIPWREDLESKNPESKVNYSEYLNSICNANIKRNEFYDLSNGERFYCPIKNKDLKIYLLKQVMKDTFHYIKYIFRKNIENKSEFEFLRCNYCGKKDFTNNLEYKENFGMIHHNCIPNICPKDALGFIHDEINIHSNSYLHRDDQFLSFDNFLLNIELDVGTINFKLCPKT